MPVQHTIWIPALYRDLTGGAETIMVEGDTVGDLVNQLDAQFPGFKARLTEAGQIKANIAIAVNGEVTHRGLRERLTVPSEVHFIPALSGGSR